MQFFLEAFLTDKLHAETQELRSTIHLLDKLDLVDSNLMLLDHLCESISPISLACSYATRPESCDNFWGIISQKLQSIMSIPPFMNIPII